MLMVPLALWILVTPKQASAIANLQLADEPATSARMAHSICMQEISSVVTIAVATLAVRSMEFAINLQDSACVILGLQDGHAINH